MFIVILWKCSESPLVTGGRSGQPKEREKGRGTRKQPFPPPLIGQANGTTRRKRAQLRQSAFRPLFYQAGAIHDLDGAQPNVTF
jgi:hypothetical protein